MHHIEQLKRLVLQSRDLDEPFNYFFDFMDDNELFKITSHRPIKELDQYGELLAVIQVIQEEINKRLNTSTTQLIPAFFEMPEHHFFHGSCLSSSMVIPLTVIYFSDVQTGMCTITSADMHTDIMRFSLAKVSELKKMH